MDIEKLSKFYPSVLLCVFFHHTSVIFRHVAKAMRLKIPSSDEKIHYKIFQKQNLDSFSIFPYAKKGSEQ